MQAANVKLSEKEFSLVTNAEIFLTKNGIITKVSGMFAAVSRQFQEQLKNKTVFSEQVLAITPKIYRGEQYLSLPYVMLDYPRYFSKDHTLAIRSFFWWGNYFSITLLLEGAFLQQYFPGLSRSQNASLLEGWFFSTGKDKWNLNRESDQLLPAAACLREPEGMSGFKEKPFLKLTRFLPLTQWDHCSEFFTDGFAVLTKILET